VKYILYTKYEVDATQVEMDAIVKPNNIPGTMKLHANRTG